MPPLSSTAAAARAHCLRIAQLGMLFGLQSYSYSASSRRPALRMSARWDWHAMAIR